MGRVIYMPRQEQPSFVRYQRRSWGPLLLVGGLLLLAAVGLAVIVLTNSSL